MAQNVLTITGITTASGAFVNGAPAAVTVSPSGGGAPLPGAAWPIPMAYVPGSNGNYTVTIPATVALTPGVTYTASVTLTGAQGALSLLVNFQASASIITPAPGASNTYGFQPAAGEVILQAYRRIGIARPMVDREKLTDARNELNYLFVSWANQGPNLWAVDRITLPLVAGVTTYAIDAATVDILDATISTPAAGSERLITSVSRSDYAACPNKAQTGAPTMFWLDRLVAPTITVWPVPDASTTYTLAFYRWRQMQDAELSGGQTLDLPYRWLDAVTWGLAERLAFIWAMDKLPAVAPKAALEYQKAAAEDTEDAPVRFAPDMSGYWR